MATEKLSGIPGNFITHRPSWREALVIAKEQAETEADASYWQHEINAFDRSFDRLWDLMRTSPTSVDSASPSIIRELESVLDEVDQLFTSSDCANMSAWHGRVARHVKDALSGARAMLAASPTPPAEQPIGEVVVTKTKDGQIVAVTRQDDEGRILSVIATSDPAEQQAAPKVAQTWCNGCTPENCFGCHIPSNEQAILKAAPTPLSERDDTELIQTMLEVFETLAERLPENRSTIKTCYAINDLDRDRVHLMVNLLRKRLENK